MMQFIVSLVLLCRTLNAFPLETMAKIVDQDDAAGGYMYSYRSDSNGPSQMYYLEKPEEIIDLRQFNDFEAPAEPSAQPLLFYPASFPSSTNAPYYSSHYDADILPYLASYKTQHVPTVTPQYKPSAKLVKYNNRKPSRGSEEKFAKYQQKAPSSGSYSSSDETGESNGDKSEYKKHSDHSDHAAHHKGGSHQEEGGQEHEEQFKKKSGKKSSKDYKSESHFDKAAKGSYDKEDHAGEDEEEGAHKEAKYDGYDKHSEHESSGKNKKGGQFKAKKQHKKGSKTTGYHNVFMKDEYKKDHTFYGELAEPLNAIRDA